MQILFCDDPGIVRVIALVKTLLNIVRFSLPIILIIMIILDLYKNMINGNSDSKESIIKKSGNRIISCIVVFILPTIINLFLKFLSTIEIYSDDYTNDFATCYNESSIKLANKLEKNRNLKLSEEEEKKRTESALKYAETVAKEKALQEARANSSNNSGNNSSGGTYYDKTTNTTKQNGGVYVQNGVFYYPKGESGHGCPSNPLSQGYNNSYGYHNEFWNRLQKLKAGAKSAGYDIGFSSQGCRSFKAQKQTYKKYASTPGRAAKPGNSKHGWGIASDVVFYKDSTHTCGTNRTYTNCPGMEWIHKNAHKYGLTFPFLKARFKEDWHIEPIEKKKY